MGDTAGARTSAVSQCVRSGTCRGGQETMNGADVTFTVFTKPWKTPLHALGAFLKKLGFDGIELPVRPGFQVEPEQVARKLPEAAPRLPAPGSRRIPRVRRPPS